MRESPELLQILSELKHRLQVVREQVYPIVSQVQQSQQCATSEGLSYLETKLHLLLSYCTLTNKKASDLKIFLISKYKKSLNNESSEMKTKLNPLIMICWRVSSKKGQYDKAD